MKFKGKALLAPLHGFTNNAFRLLCQDFGAAMTYVPIMNENSVLNNVNQVLDVVEGEGPIGGQLIGNDSLKLAKAARLVEPSVDLIDLNFGCPRPKEVRCNIGSVLMRKPEKIKKLVSSVVKAVTKPVTVKIRLGYKEVNVLEVAKLCEEAGARAITLHARTAVQTYSTPADWSWIKKLKKSVSIPVIGNGDVFSPMDAQKMLNTTGCDAVMIARAAMGNPFIFEQVNDFLESGVFRETLPIHRFKAFNQYIQYYIKFSETPSISDLRFYIPRFIKDFVGAKELRVKLMKQKSIKALLGKIESITQSLQ